jgi:hypothetical protein
VIFERSATSEAVGVSTAGAFSPIYGVVPSFLTSNTVRTVLS